MSNFGGNRAQAAQQPVLPTGVTVASYPTYQAATEAVDTLVSKDFPVQSVTIVGTDLKAVERILGSMSYAKAAVSGLASGIWFGFFLGLLMLIWNPGKGSTYLFAALLLGAGFGMISGLVTYAISRRRKNYQSVNSIVATSYSLVVEPSHAGKARNALGITVDLGAGAVPTEAPRSAAPGTAASGPAAPAQPERPQPTSSPKRDETTPPSSAQ